MLSNDIFILLYITAMGKFIIASLWIILPFP